VHVMNTSTKREVPLPKLPAGVVGSLRWHKNGQELGFSLNMRGGREMCIRWMWQPEKWNGGRRARRQ